MTVAKKKSVRSPVFQLLPLPAANTLTGRPWTLDEGTRRALIGHLRKGGIRYWSNLLSHVDDAAGVYLRTIKEDSAAIRANMRRISTAAGQLRAALNETIGHWPMAISFATTTREKGKAKTVEDAETEIASALGQIKKIELAADFCAGVYKKPRRRPDRLPHRAALILQTWRMYPPQLQKLSKSGHFTLTITLLLSAVDPDGAWARGSVLRYCTEAAHREIMRAKAYCKTSGTLRWD